MIETEPNSDREQLNRIAEQRDGDDLPEHTSWDEVTAICDRLYEQVGDIIATHVEETPLTEQEAQAWVLSNYVDPARIHLTNEAIALVLTAPNTPFTVSDGEVAEEEDEVTVTATDVEERYQHAKGKYKAAKNYVGLTTFRKRGEVFETPTIEWLDQNTVVKLRNRRRETDQTLDDIVSRLLDETVKGVTLDEVIETVTEEYENIACIVVHHLRGDAHLSIKVFTPDIDTDYEVADLYSPNHQIRIERDDDSVRWGFELIATCEGPETWNNTSSTTIYMADNVHNANPLDLETGLKYLKEKLKYPDQWENDRSLRPLAQIRQEAKQ